uniref:F5/8 type C domain-containing protein n=1 Tax=Magallana gigas TaxID=29159 RepID=A0A8W8HL61_MAGGI
MKHKAQATPGCAIIPVIHHQCIIVLILAGWLATDEVLGCNEYMVDTVTDDKLTASSIYNLNYPAAKARLSSTGWSPDKDEHDPWIQVDFGRPLTMVAVVTKGLNFKTFDEYVKKYKVRYSNTSVNWMTVFNGTNDEFEANSDRTTPVTNTLPSPIVARYLRLYPTEYYSYRSLRFDVIGCEGNANLKSY